MKTKLQINILAMGFILFLFAAINLTAQTNWDKYEGNPVFEEFGTWASDGVAAPSVLYEDGIFKMWFYAGGNIGYAESTDGITWVPNDDPVIPAGTPGNWDEERGHPYVIRVNDTLKMWFAGSSDGWNWDISIGYAWSVDNIEWNIWPDRVLEKGEPGSWDENAVYKPAVCYDGNTYQMWYDGFEGIELTDPERVGYATSIDGINWEKDMVHNPVMDLGESGTFYETWIGSSCVLFLNNEYQMWFSGWDAFTVSPMRYFRIGYATSTNGIEWTVQNNSMAVVDHGPVDTWDESRAMFPSVLVHEGQYKMWYSGISGFSAKIGYALGDSVIANISEQYTPALDILNIAPSPFTSSTTISYQLTYSSPITLEIYNYTGQRVLSLVNKVENQGSYEVIFDSKALKSGIYFCVLKTNERIQTKKIIKLD